MKETLFEMLLSLFETTLLRLKEVNASEEGQSTVVHDKKPNLPVNLLTNHEKVVQDVYHMMVLKEANEQSMRVYSRDEQMKLSKASYQFLMRLHTWNIISSQVMELIVNRLMLSDSHIVSLQETKWVVRTLLGDKLSFEQLAYLDLVLYHKEDAIVRH
jgi:uncharacterized protein Smg (DUF494 family)